MAATIVSGSVPATDHPSSEIFPAHCLAALNGPPEPINPQAQARACCLRARECLREAQYAREDGDEAKSAVWLRAARMARMAAQVWQERARDGLNGMRWWNAIPEPARKYWMETAGNTGVAADAWDAFKRARGLPC